MREIWFQEYERVWNECDENTTEEQIIAKTDERFRERLADMVEARMLQQAGRLN